MQTTGIQWAFRRDSSLLPRPLSLSPWGDNLFFYRAAHPTSVFLPSAPIPNPRVLPLGGSISPPPSPPHGWIVALGFPHRAEDHSSSIFSGFAALLAIFPWPRYQERDVNQEPASPTPTCFFPHLTLSLIDKKRKVYNSLEKFKHVDARQWKSL